MTNEKPLVSVVVTAYNSEAYIERCLDNLVNQTLENIEIVVVNNGSTDRTLEIVNRYIEMYPEKIVVYTIDFHDRAGYGRNYGLSKARADYLASCDSDDYMEYQSLELLYNKAIEGNHDLVDVPYYYVLNGRKQVVGRYNIFNTECTPENLIRHSPYSFWSKLIHKDVIAKAGKTIEDFGFDDVGYIPVMLQYCENPGYLDVPLYHYLIRTDSDSRNIFRLQTLEYIQALDFTLEKTLPEFIEPVLYSMIRRLWILLSHYWVFYDIFIDFYKKIESKYLKDFDEEQLSNEFINKFNILLAKAAPEPMSTNVYINGFNNADVSERVNELAEIAFYNETSVVVLNEKNCDIAENKIIKEKYEHGLFDQVAEYFAIKGIYENGGIYIGDCIRVNAPFNYVRYNISFFSYLDKHNFSDKVFGGIKGNTPFEELLATYSKDFFADYSTADRIKAVISPLYNIPLDKSIKVELPGIYVYGPETFVAAAYNLDEINLAEHDFSDKINDDEYIVLKRTTVQALGNTYIHMRNKDQKRITKEKDHFKKRFYRIKRSKTFRLTMALLAPYRFLKRILKKG